jgi:hypothetical protein
MPQGSYPRKGILGAPSAPRYPSTVFRLRSTALGTAGLNKTGEQP